MTNFPPPGPGEYPGQPYQGEQNPGQQGPGSGYPGQPYGGYQAYPAQPYGSGYSPYGPQNEPAHGGLATAALVLGIIGLVLGLIPFAGYFGAILSILAIIFGIIAWQWGKAKVGLILAAVGLLATVLWTVLFIAVFHNTESNVQRYNHCVDNGGTYDSCHHYLDDN